MGDETKSGPALGEPGDFVVACDHDYYSTVRFSATREEADASAAEMERDGGSGTSYKPSRPRIVVAEVLRSIALPEPER